MIEKDLILSGEYFKIKGMPYVKALMRHYINKAKKFNYSNSVVKNCIQEINYITVHLDKHELNEMRDETIKTKRLIKDEQFKRRSN